MQINSIVCYEGCRKSDPWHARVVPLAASPVNRWTRGEWQPIPRVLPYISLNKVNILVMMDLDTRDVC